MDEGNEENTRRRSRAAITGDEVYFDRWLVTMREKGMSALAIKSEIEKLDHRSHSVLHYSILYGQWNLAKKLLEVFQCGQWRSPRRRTPSVVSSLDVNLPGRDGETPLHTAVQDERSDPIPGENILRYLVSHRADLSQGDDYGQ